MVDYVVGHDKDSLGKSTAEALGCPFVSFRNEYYPDGSPGPKVNMRIAATGEDLDYRDFEGKHILTFYRRKQRPNRDVVCRHLFNYPAVVASLTDPEVFNAGTVDVLYPYWVCGRQDHNPRTDEMESTRKRDKGKGLGYKNEARLFGSAGASRILTFHPHFHRKPGTISVEYRDGQGHDCAVEVVCFDLVPEMVEHARGNMTDKYLVVNPDLKDGVEMEYCLSREFAKLAGMEHGDITKMRVDSSRTEHGSDLDAGGMEVAIVDDIAATVGTVKGAIPKVKNHGDMEAFFVHPVLPGVGHERVQGLIRGSGGPLRDVSAGETIDSDYSSIPIIPCIARYYKEQETA